MARLTLSELSTAVGPWYRDKDSDELQAVANLVLRDLNMLNAGFLTERTTITTTPTSSVTVGATQGSTTVTYASASESSHKGQIIQIDGDSSWYSIDSVSDGVSFTLSSAFAGDTSASASATIAFPRIQMPSDVVHIHAIQIANKAPLARYDGEIPPGGRVNLSPSEPDAYYEVEPVNTSDYMEVMLVDPPDTYYTLQVEARKRLTRYSGPSSKCGLPEVYEHILIAGVNWMVLSQTKGGEEAIMWRAWYEDLKRTMKGNLNTSYSGTVKSPRRVSSVSIPSSKDIVTTD